MARADRQYTDSLMVWLARTVPNTDGRMWHLVQGSSTYDRMWRVCEADIVTNAAGISGPWGYFHADIASGRTESDLQGKLDAFLAGYAYRDR